MPTKVSLTPEFLKDLKHLKRKYPAVSQEVRNLVFQLEADVRLGDKIPNLGNDIYKVRLPNPSAQRGKSGGFRLIYYVQLVDKIVLLSIYSKTEQSDISAELIQNILKEFLLVNEESEQDESSDE